MSMTGIVSIKISGETIRSKPDASFSPGGKIGESIMSAAGFEGVADKEIKPGQVKFTIALSSDDDMTIWQQLREQTLIFECDSGQRYLIAEAGTVGEVAQKGNTADVTMEGKPAVLS